MIIQKKNIVQQGINIFSLLVGLCQVTKYSYLGVTISSLGNFDLAVEDLAEKARKACYAICRTHQFNPPVTLAENFHLSIKPII